MTEEEFLNYNRRCAEFFGIGFSIWKSMTEQQLIERIEEMKNEHAYLQDAIGRAETELFYRKNPDLKRL